MNPERIDSILPRVLADILARQKLAPRADPAPLVHTPPDPHPEPQTTLNLEAR